MQGYDVFMLLVLAAATVFGFWKGMAWQIASLASLVASYFVALAVSPQIAPLFGNQAPWNRFLAMLVVYLVTSMLIWMAFRVVGGAIDRLKLKEFDRQVGALFGLAKGVLLCVAITLFAVSLVSDDRRDSIMGSRSGYYIAVLLDRSHTVMPEGLHEVLHPYIHQAQHRFDPDSPEHTDDHSAADHRHGGHEHDHDPPPDPRWATRPEPEPKEDMPRVSIPYREELTPIVEDAWKRFSMPGENDR